VAAWPHVLRHRRADNNLAGLIQTLHDNPRHVDINGPKDAFDMQRRARSDTGTSSTWVQLALSLMTGYGNGKASALINPRSDACDDRYDYTT
jgi:hypothetical protein